MTKGTTVTMFSRSNDTHANNIGAKESWGHKKRENLFVNSFVGTSAGGVSYVNSKTRSTNDIQGAIVNTGVVSDIGIDGAGFMVVSDSATGEAVYTRRGDFRQDELGFWKNGGGQLLKAWKLDGNGNLPQNASLLSSLEAVNFANTKGAPVATSVISIAMNLNADQEALRGSGIDATLNTSGLNKATTSSDILFPEAAKGLNLGDVFTFQSLPDGAGQQVKFGGLVVGNRAAIGATILGATSDVTPFTFNPVVANNSLVSGESKLTINVGGASYTFTAVQGANNAKNKIFSTIKGLADAINNVSALQARVDENGRLYVAPIKADNSVTFTETGGAGTLREALGLTDLPIAAADGNVTRFNSLDTLKNAVNANQGTNSLKATIDGKEIKITSLLSTADFTIGGESLVAACKITAATLNPDNNEKGRGTVSISAPNSGLTTGDYVRIENFGGLVVNGLYTVGISDANGFTISLAVAPAAIPALGALFAAPVAGSTWQKVPGQKFAATGGCTITVAVAAAAGAVTISVPGGTVLGGAEAWANNDVVYISGVGQMIGGGLLPRDLTISDGYYIIGGYNNAGGGGAATFTITPAASAVLGGLPAFVAAGPFSVQKVGNTGGGFGGGTGTFDVPVMTTADGIASDTIKYYIGSNHGYAVRDIISLTAGGRVDNITFAANAAYKITEIGANFVKFAVPGQVATNGDEGVTDPADIKTYNTAGLANLRTNNFSRFFKFFGINQEKTTYDKTYDAENVEKNLISGKLGSENTFSHPLTVHDSLGSSHTVLLNFAKLKNNQWAVEISSQKDKDGIYDLSNAGENGLIANGMLTFDENGGIKISEISDAIKKIKLTYKNGAADGDLTLDWPNIESKIKSGTVSQTKNPNNVEIVQGNGQPAGTLTKLEVSSDGFIVGTFDSGESRKLYQIPVALFANVNGLIAGSNGVFEISRESGELLLKAAGVGGAGNTLGGVLEASNVDSTSELLAVQELSNTIRANARVAATEFKNIQTILSELNQ